MYTYPFVILINLDKVNSKKNNKFLLDLFGSYIDSLAFTILNLSLSTKVCRNCKNAQIYTVYYTSPLKVYECIKSDLISVYPYTHIKYKKLNRDKAYHVISRDNILLISEKHARYMLDYIQSYIDGQV